MNRILFFASVVLVLVIVLGVGFISLYRWDSVRNRGHKWGYWGEFNTVSNALATLPGVTILNAYCNQDVTLEEFGFDILTAQKQKLHIGFDENDPGRVLSGEALRAALLSQIQKQSSTQATTNPQGLPK
jgi:hypothetical protein